MGMLFATPRIQSMIAIINLLTSQVSALQVLLSPLLQVKYYINLLNSTAIVLQAPFGYVTYQWNNGLTSSSIIVSEPGSYFVTVTDSGNCQASSDVVNVTFSPTTGVFSDNIITQPNTVSDSSENSSDIIPIIGGVLGGLFLIILASLLFAFIVKKKSKKDHPLNDIPLTEVQTIPKTTLKGLAILEVVGTGQFGKVYRGIINSCSVALKEITSNDSNMNKEAEILS